MLTTNRSQSGQSTIVMLLAGLALGAVLALGVRAALHDGPDESGDGAPMASATHATSGQDAHTAHDHGGPAAAPTPAATPASTGLLVDIENELCPVMGGATQADVFTDWNGLRVRHCCPGCTEDLLANPEKLLDEVSTSWRRAAELIERANAGDDAALTTLRSEFNVVREPTAGGGR